MLYTGGPKPYGYEGLGELFVFLFFGVVAVVGSYYVQTEDLTGLAFALSVPIGLLAAAILMVNNIRDIDTDRRAGKRTLAVRLGRERARALCVGDRGARLPACCWCPRSPNSRLELLLALGSRLPLALSVLDAVSHPHRRARRLNAALAGAGRLLGAFAIVLSAALLIS